MANKGSEIDVEPPPPLYEGQEHHHHHHVIGTNQVLPQNVRITVDKRKRTLKLRQTPYVLRLHKFKAEHNIHEHCYSELLLYYPWRDENSELHAKDEEKCLDLYHQVQEIIEHNKNIFLPFSKEINKVEQANLEEDIHAAHAFDKLDPEGRQQDEDDDELGLVPDETYGFLDPGDLVDIPEKQAKSKVFHPERAVFRVTLRDRDDMCQAIQQQSLDQHVVFEQVIKYVKSLIKHSNGSLKLAPKPPLLLIHGGAGRGKSKLIDDISSATEYLIRTVSPGSSNRPAVLRCAFTGIAACNISGSTLNHTFRLNFGNKLWPLNDSMREELRQDFQDVILLIIDEVSMVKPDTLYQVHERLIEVKQSKELFGGVAVLLVGDLMQLRPVLAGYVWTKPKNPDYHHYHEVYPLFDNFICYNLTTNHRQGNTEFNDMLERIRFGEHTEKDIDILKKRMITHSALKTPKFQHAKLIFGTNQKVIEANEDHLNSLPGECCQK